MYCLRFDFSTSSRVGLIRLFNITNWKVQNDYFFKKYKQNIWQVGK